ncbi:MAG: biotin--[Clostridia bacterium]|nr:biotin--[acetyl-CoA-carboxylase] ligase [Clostridia bacterium]
MLNDRFDLESFSHALGEDSPVLCVMECTDSTNEQAKRMAIAGERRTALIAAAEQTAGRGRLGRSFYSPDQTGVYFSILLTVTKPLQSAVSLTGAAAVAVMRAIRSQTGQQCSIKWVNDLYLDGKKVCGILAEALSGLETGTQQVILGIGVNLCTEVFPEELIGKAGAVHGKKTSRVDLIAAIWRELCPFLQDFEDRSWLTDYRTHSMVIGKDIVWRKGEESHRGCAVDINGDGELIVRNREGEEQILRTGEISILLEP